MFGHDTQQALETIVALVNTDPVRNDDEGLPDVEALRKFVAECAISHDATLTDADVAAVQQLRGRFADFFGTDDADRAAALANELLAVATVRPRLTDHDGYPRHMHYFSPDATLAEHLAVDGGMAISHVIVAEELDRLRLCEAPKCHAVLLDLSRNSSKRYCDASTCGNRLHVAAYRERQRTARLRGA